MLSPIKAFDYVNSTIQNVAGDSFSLSHILQNIDKVALPIIVAVGMYMSTCEAAIASERNSNDPCEDFCRNDCRDFCDIVGLEERMGDTFFLVFSACLHRCLREYC